MKRLVVLAGLSAMLVGASACNSQTPGQANPATTVTKSPSADTPTSAVGNALPVNHACSLLSSSDLEQLGASASPTQEMVGTAHACEFSSPDFTMALGIRTNVGLAGFTSAGGTVHDTTIGAHQAKQVIDDTGSCLIGIGVSASSRVDVTVLSNGNQDPCPTALKMAGLIEPRLP